MDHKKKTMKSGFAVDLISKKNDGGRISGTINNYNAELYGILCNQNCKEEAKLMKENSTYWPQRNLIRCDHKVKNLGLTFYNKDFAFMR
jgi:hypothetical protein